MAFADMFGTNTLDTQLQNRKILSDSEYASPSDRTLYPAVQTMKQGGSDFLSRFMGGNQSGNDQLASLLGGVASAVAPQGSSAQRVGTLAQTLAGQSATARVKKGLSEAVAAGDSDIFAKIDKSDLALANPEEIQSLASLLSGNRLQKEEGAADRGSREKMASEGEAEATKRAKMSIEAQFVSDDKNISFREWQTKYEDKASKELESLRQTGQQNLAGIKTPDYEAAQEGRRLALHQSAQQEALKTIQDAFDPLKGRGWMFDGKQYTNMTDFSKALAEKRMSVIDLANKLGTQTYYNALDVEAYRAYVRGGKQGEFVAPSKDYAGLGGDSSTDSTDSVEDEASEFLPGERKK